MYNPLPVLPSGTASSTEVGPRCWSFIRTSERSSLLFNVLRKDNTEEVADLILSGKRCSTNRQYECCWARFKDWLKSHQKWDPRIQKSTVLEFFHSLIEEGKMSALTSGVYGSSLVLPMSMLNIDLSSWEFGGALKAAFIKNPQSSKTLPTWDLDKVLDLLRSPTYCGHLNHSTG